MIITTVTLECPHQYAPSNKHRVTLLEDIVEQNRTSDILLFPAGFLTHRFLRQSKMKQDVASLVSILKKYDSNATICYGVDSLNKKEQLAFAVSQSGIIAAGRKFYPTIGEKGAINLADGYDAPEQGYSRFFYKNGKKLYLAVCYDCFGLRHQDIPNPDVDVILVLAHRFHKRGEGPSGEVDFARKGFAGAAMQWNCPVFGTAVFFNRTVPENWPTGIYWESGDQSIKSFKYSDNLMQWSERCVIDGVQEKALCYSYCI